MTEFRPDPAAYLRAHAWMAAGGMALAMAALWLAGNPHVWTGALGGLAAVALRGTYLRSEELARIWRLDDGRLLGPGDLILPLGQIAKVRTLGSYVQVITLRGDKHLIKYQASAAATQAAIERACP